jgi:hypothetical protein
MLYTLLVCVRLITDTFIGALGAVPAGDDPPPPPPQAVNTKVNRIGIIYCTGAPVVIDNPIITG